MNECIITSVVAIIALVIFFWVVYPMFNKDSNGAIVTEEFERFDNGNEAESEADSKPEGNMVQEPPYVDPKAGAMLDGPGFEKGEIDDVYQEAPNGIPSNYYFLDDGADGEMSIQHNLCSKSCCGSQYPSQHKMKYDPYVCAAKKDDKFVPSNTFCSNSFSDSGCLCINKSQASFLYNRGGNGREWF